MIEASMVATKKSDIFCCEKKKAPKRMALRFVVRPITIIT
jgi:hypothetical protein